MKGDDAKFYASHDFAQFGVGISNYFKVNRVLQSCGGGLWRRGVGRQQRVAVREGKGCSNSSLSSRGWQ
jgi:hypothetical protein